MPIDISVGTEFHVALGAPATYDEAGFTGVVMIYDEVGEVGSIPEFGGSAQVAEWISLKSGEVQKRPGSINYGSISLPLADVTDDGQDALKDGFDGANARAVHSFKVFRADIGGLAFTGVITGYTYNRGDANSISQASCSIELTGKPVVIAAA